MKKSLFFVLLVLIFCSCTLDNSVSDVLDNSVGTVSFCTDISRGVTASIEYPTLLDKTWTLVTTKMDNGGTVGQDTYENFLLTDTLTLSVGSWRFVITDSEDKITGAVIATIKAGSNTVSLTVHSTKNKGTLSFENCNYLTSKIGQVLYSRGLIPLGLHQISHRKMMIIMFFPRLLSSCQRAFMRSDSITERTMAVHLLKRLT